MIHNGKTIKGFVFVSDEGIKTTNDVDDWITLALDFNTRAKAAPKKKEKNRLDRH